jgi:hypothetical protein
MSKLVPQPWPPQQALLGYLACANHMEPRLNGHKT